jgi:hypothetical protein
MGEHRDYRFIIPGAILLLTFALTVYLGSGFDENPIAWLAALGDKDQGAEALLSAILALVVASLAGGFICGSITIFFRGTPGTADTVDMEKMKTGLKDSSLTMVMRNWTDAGLMSECQIRLHSHAPKELIEFGTRRLTSMYVSHNSITAMVMGWFIGEFALARYVFDCDTFADICECVVFGQLVGVVSGLLFIRVLSKCAQEAQREHCDMLCKFMYWDSITNPPQQNNMKPE